MVTLALTVITDAYYRSGIVSRNFESLTADEMTDGLTLLNDVINDINASGRYIPYFNYISINCVVGQETYFIADAQDLFTATFNIGPVRYEMYHDSLKHYFGAPRVDNINALPFTWFWERTLGGINVNVYFLPQDTFVMKFKCKKILPQVTQTTDLSLTYDPWYILFLKYRLISYICDFYNVSVPPTVAEKLKHYDVVYANVNAMDLSIKKVSTYAVTDSLTYAQVNIGKGWTAPI